MVAFVGCGILRLTAGWVSLLAFPRHLVRGSSFHGISLIITPTLAGLTMTGLGYLRRRRGEPVLRIDKFLCAAVFAFGMALFRLLYARS